MKNIDKIKGCLLAGAAGDALGYSIEFDSESTIFARYGDAGITKYELCGDIARISDDTQMTLFTANGLLRTDAIIDKPDVDDYRREIANCYKDWLRTQRERYPEMINMKPRYSWLIEEPRLHSRRAPGNTCQNAITQGAHGSVASPINESHGCGGVMRVAPVGLNFDQSVMDCEKTVMIGAEAAAITHGNELGYLPAAVLAYMVNRLSQEDISILEAARQSIPMLRKLFPASDNLNYQIELIDRAILLAESPQNDLEAIHRLGAGWKGEEALAIALYCAIKYSEDLDRALIASVNHSGDSDSTGAITGNIVGAHLGVQGIPSKYLDHLELRDVIEELAGDLYNGIANESIRQKYAIQA